MKIVISGVGETGYFLSQILLREGHDLVLIEQNDKVYRNAQEHLDAQIILGNGANPLILEPVVDEDTDLFLALTDNDPTNILSSLIARRFGAKRCIVRIGDSAHLIHPLLTDDPKISVVNAEMAVSKDLIRLVGNPAADEIEFFGGGKAEMMKLHVSSACPIIHKKLKEIQIPDSWLFIAVTRRGQFMVLSGESVLEPGDHLLIMGDPQKNREIEDLLGLKPFEVHRVIIIGSTEIAESVARSLQKKGIEVRIVEDNAECAEKAAARLDDILVLHGDGTSDEVLAQAGIEQTDMVLALTGDDESNILISLLAKERKVTRVVALAQKPQYKSIIEKIGIDTVLSPRYAMVDEIMRSIHHEDISAINILEGGQGQMMEFVVREKTRYVDVPLANVKLPKRTLIGAIVRGDELIIPRGSDRIQVGDRIVVFTMRSALKEAKKIFA